MLSPSRLSVQWLCPYVRSVGVCVSLAKSPKGEEPLFFPFSEFFRRNLQWITNKFYCFFAPDNDDDQR